MVTARRRASSPRNTGRDFDVVFVFKLNASCSVSDECKRDKKPELLYASGFFVPANDNYYTTEIKNYASIFGCAFLGGLLGKALLKKHFKKAGIA